MLGGDDGTFFLDEANKTLKKCLEICSFEIPESRFKKKKQHTDLDAGKDSPFEIILYLLFQIVNKKELACEAVVVCITWVPN